MKRVYLILVIFFLVISCNKTKEKNVEVAANEKLIKTYFKHFNNHDWEKMANMYIENAEFKDPTLGKGMVKQSRKQIVEKYSELNKIFPDLNDKVIQIYPSGKNHIVVEFISSGTAPNNSKFELPICTIFTIKNGMIIRDFTYFDNFDK